MYILSTVFFFFYFRALKDAEKAVALCPSWPKGYYRKGRALLGLKVSLRCHFSNEAAMFNMCVSLKLF